MREKSKGKNENKRLKAKGKDGRRERGDGRRKVRKPSMRQQFPDMLDA
jgi:hypothetical protein